MLRVDVVKVTVYRSLVTHYTNHTQFSWSQVTGVALHPLEADLISVSRDKVARVMSHKLPRPHLKIGASN